MPNSSQPERVRLIVLFGGRSAEHDVSRVTAAHVIAAVDRKKFEIVPIAITRDGQWLDATGALSAFSGDEEAALELETVLADGITVETSASTKVALSSDIALATSSEMSTVVLPLLHGPYGEDGTIQGLLEMASLPYVGSGVLGSALAMDKAKAKEVIAQAGIPQCRWRSLEISEISTETVDRLINDLGLPLFVKPANLGSSVGVSKAHNAAQVLAALETASQYDEWIVVEEAVQGREIELAVLGNKNPKVSLAGEVKPGAEFYSYEDKYLDGNAAVIIPADLPPQVSAQAQELALASFRALRAEGMARVDFFYESPGRGLLLNEINTIPGFTPISMYPKLWEASGLSYGALIEELVMLAQDRFERRQKFAGTGR